MLDFIKLTWKELNEEAQYISQNLRHWWGAMSEGEQLFFVGIVSAAMLLIGLRKPTKSKSVSYDRNEAMGILQQFAFAAVVLVVFTFGIDIAMESFS